MTLPHPSSPRNSAVSNPYASPQVPETPDAADDELTKTLRMFGRSMRSFTILSIFLGSLPLVFIAVILSTMVRTGGLAFGSLEFWLFAICLVISGGFFALGFTCMCRWTMGLWIVLVGAYIALAVCVILLFFAPVLALGCSAICAAMLIGAHQCLAQARKLRAHGIPLTARPEDLAGRENI